MSQAEGVAYSLIVINEAAQNLDRHTLIDGAPCVLSLIGLKSADPVNTLHQMFSDSRDDSSYLAVSRVDHALSYQKPSLYAALIFRHF